MRKMDRRKPQATEVGSWKSQLDIKRFASLIILLDGYRVNRFEDLKWVDRAAGEGKFGRKFASQWDEVRKILCKMAAIPGYMSHLTKWVTIQTYLLLIGSIFSVTVSVLFVGVFLSYMTWKVVWLQKMLLYISVPAVIGMAAAFLGRPLISYKVAKEVDRYCADHPEKFGPLRLQVKDIVQKLISDFSKYIQIAGKDLNEHRIALYNVDYAGIKVVKKPTRFSKYYFVRPQT